MCRYLETARLLQSLAGTAVGSLGSRHQTVWSCKLLGFMLQASPFRI